MHYVTYIKGEDPVVCAVVLHTQGASCRDFKPLLNLQLVHLFKSLEGNLQLFLFSHAVLEKVSALPKVQLTYRAKLFLNID